MKDIIESNLRLDIITHLFTMSTMVVKHLNSYNDLSKEEKDKCQEEYTEIQINAIIKLVHDYHKLKTKNETKNKP